MVSFLLETLRREIIFIYNYTPGVNHFSMLLQNLKEMITLPINEQLGIILLSDSFYFLQCLRISQIFYSSGGPFVDN
jgi:hypothetical protein